MIFYDDHDFNERPLIDVAQTSLKVRAIVAERNEQTRIFAQRICDQANAGNVMANPETLTWARQFVERVKPLGRALGET